MPGAPRPEPGIGPTPSRPESGQPQFGIVAEGPSSAPANPRLDISGDVRNVATRVDLVQDAPLTVVADHGHRVPQVHADALGHYVRLIVFPLVQLTAAEIAHARAVRGIGAGVVR